MVISKDKKKIIFNVIFLLLCFGLTLFYVFRGEDFGEVFRFIRHAKSAGWLLGVGLVVAFILGESIIIYYLPDDVLQNCERICVVACGTAMLAVLLDGGHGHVADVFRHHKVVHVGKCTN